MNQASEKRNLLDFQILHHIFEAKSIDHRKRCPSKRNHQKVLVAKDINICVFFLVVDVLERPLFKLKQDVFYLTGFSLRFFGQIARRAFEIAAFVDDLFELLVRNVGESRATSRENPL